jgi:hypothetical protein
MTGTSVVVRVGMLVAFLLVATVTVWIIPSAEPLRAQADQVGAAHGRSGGRASGRPSAAPGYVQPLDDASKRSASRTGAVQGPQLQLAVVQPCCPVESFEQGMKRFDLRIRAGEDTDSMRPRFEEILRRFELKYDLSTYSDEEVCYDVQVPLETRTVRISNAILRLDPGGHASVEWTDKKGK